jgi:hypothetical protein
MPGLAILTESVDTIFALISFARIFEKVDFPDPCIPTII